jgi:hypothetical protein
MTGISILLLSKMAVLTDCWFSWLL